MINFELIVVKDVKCMTRFFFFFLYMDVQLFQHHLLKQLSFLHCSAFAPLSKISWLYSHGHGFLLSVQVVISFTSIQEAVTYSTILIFSQDERTYSFSFLRVLLTDILQLSAFFETGLSWSEWLCARYEHLLKQVSFSEWLAQCE